MLNSGNILPELKQRFPDFEIPPEAEGLHTVVFSFFVDYLGSAFEFNNKIIIDKASRFINEMCGSNNDSVQVCIDEIVLGFYTDPVKPYEMLKKSLSIESQLRFEKTTILWDKQKKIE